MTATKPSLRIPDVLKRAWLDPFLTKSDFARKQADSIAAAASLGYITTRTGAAQFERCWAITPAGLGHLWIALGLDE